MDFFLKEFTSSKGSLNTGIISPDPLTGPFSNEVPNKLISWDALLALAKSFRAPKLLEATSTLTTLLAIVNAMQNREVIALIDPSTPETFKQKIRSKLELFLKKRTSMGFGIVLLTSGTTSEPKLLFLSERALYYSALGAVEFLKINQTSYLPLTLPLHHVSGLGIFFRSFLAKATLHLFSGGLLKAFSSFQTKISHLSLVRTQASALLEKKLLQSSPSLQCVLLGGSSIPLSLQEDLETLPYSCYLSYGMSETASLVWAYSLQERKGSILPYRKLFSKHQELFVGGDTLFDGYIQEDGSITISLTDGYFKTPDLGEYDEKTEMLTIFGRSDDVFLFGGENISTKELEEALLQIPGIDLALIAPLPSMQYGHVPLAILATSQKFDLSRWKEQFALVLPKVKMPKVIVTLGSNFAKDAPDAKQRLAKAKKEIIQKLANFEALEEEDKVQTWSY